MASIHIRIDDKLKRRLQKILKEMGLDISGAATLYLRYIVQHQHLPFVPSAKPMGQPLLSASGCQLCRRELRHE